MHYSNISIIDIEGEVWKEVDGFPDYRVSNMGRIKSLSKLKVRSNKTGNFITKDRIIKQRHDVNGGGYLYLSICNTAGKHQKTAHVIVANAFIPNPENKPEVNHKFGIKTDNRVSQLEWATKSENQKHSYRIGLNSKAGEKHHLAKLNDEKVSSIRKMSEVEKVPNFVIAKHFNVSQQTVCGIIKRRTWTHI